MLLPDPAMEERRSKAIHLLILLDLLKVVLGFLITQTAIQARLSYRTMLWDLSTLIV